uniref:Uncharacterized protein n=1 Tax=Chromera velia CCMP2878 TaxID=1169474 RepID=A0A0G4HDB1_9ALVE|eukprot:Cvel_26479.t1-p1 / transcript=Cvel_26479.t1 / gene=Cvel_26479 / organism=Chromera_velia_CCMP2878 / gene_product=hypothetical protein / transcript_product=hypothetical protein / location=Cvel_scaffold3154:6427-7188(+) / protein_length=254 / sequence_SO=supercontig / SO=protein_coding / is_pseudo=false
MPTALLEETDPQNDTTKTQALAKTSAVIPVSRQPPLPPRAPAAFDTLLDTKKFTNGADSDTVKVLYKQFVQRTAGSVQRVSFASWSLFSDDDAECLRGLFLHLLKTPTEGGGAGGILLEHLNLSGTQLTDKGAFLLVRVLSEIKSLRGLSLMNIQISVATLTALFDGVRLGGFQSLGYLDLSWCENLAKDLKDEDVEALLDIARIVTERGRRLTLDVQGWMQLLSISRKGWVALRKGQERLSEVEWIDSWEGTN